jgi:hypothetical protein
MTTSAQSINSGGQNFTERSPCQFSSLVKLFLRPRKSIFPFHSITYVNTAIKGHKKSQSQISMMGSSQNFRLLSAPKKIPDQPNKKTYPNGMCPTNVKKTDDIKHVMKYTDHDHHGFWTSILAWETTSSED